MKVSRAAKLINAFNEADFDQEDQDLLQRRVHLSKIDHVKNNWVQDQLELIVTNDGHIYRTMIAPLINKMKNPQYPKDRAEVEWCHIVKAAMLRYQKEAGLENMEHFPVKVQIQTAHDLTEKYYRRIENGDFD